MASSLTRPTTGDPDLDAALADPNAVDNKGSNVVVVCRVRPFNRREIEIQDDMNSHIGQEWERKPLRSVVEMEGGDTVFLDHNNNYAERQRFPFDISFWSVPPHQQQTGKNPVADQKDMYRQVGIPIIRNIWNGFNSCVFAYGQTGSGKTFSMMGPQSEVGLIPRICEGLFNSIEKRRQEDALEPQGDGSVLKEYKLEARFFEIYNEKVKDLLWALRTPSDEDANIDKENIRVRHFGTEISLVGLTCVQVDNAEDCLRLIEEGTRNRSVGATKMNDESSRSHSIFRLTFTQTTRVLPKDKFEKPKVYNRVSTVSLVDLAGSERMKKTGAEGQRLKEAVAINQSLTTLKNVIDALVEQRSVVPYRDSTLTWILSDNLGGNSKTFMIACISPHLDNADETLNTLRYALRTQAVVCHATVNESDELKKMNKMKEELEKLQQQYSEGSGDSEYVNLKSKQADLNKQASETKEQAEQAARQEAKTKRDLEQARRRRANLCYRAAFHRVFQKRVDLAYTAYFARDGATLAGLKREVDSYKHDSSSTDKELSDLRAEERRTSSALKNSEAELARQRDRMENTQASLRELDKTEARNTEEIIARNDTLPRSVHVSKQVVQRKLFSISIERERILRKYTGVLDKMKEEQAEEIEQIRQERALKLEPLSQREREIQDVMRKEDQEHKTNMQTLKERLTKLQSSCVFVENENKRSASEVDEAILQGNKDRFEAFAASETESKKKLQEFQVQSKASLASELERMRLNLSEGQFKHDRQIDRILEKTRDDVLRMNRESEVRANTYQDELKSRLQRFENLNGDAGQCLRSAKAAQRRYSDGFVHVLQVLSGSAPPEINTADEMDSVEEVIKKLQQTMGLTVFSNTQLNKNQSNEMITAVDSSSASSPSYQHQSHTPLAFRTALQRQHQHDQQHNNNNGSSTPRAGQYSRSTSQTPSHHSGSINVTRNNNNQPISPASRNVRFSDPNNNGNSGNNKLRSPSSVSNNSKSSPGGGGNAIVTSTSQLSFDAPPVLQRRAPPVYQTATSKLRQAYAEKDKKITELYIKAASQEKPFTPRIHSPNSADEEDHHQQQQQHSSSNSRGRSPRKSPSSSRRRSSVPFSPDTPWNNYDNYFGYKSLANNEEPVLYSQRVVIEGSVIAMRTRTGADNKQKSPSRREMSRERSAGRGAISPSATTPRR